MIVGVIVLNVLWSAMVSGLLVPVFGMDVPRPGEDSGPGIDIANVPWMLLVVGMAFDLLIEEVVRLAPLMIVIHMTGGRQRPVVIATFVTAALFGAMHWLPNNLPLWYALSVQGMAGLFLNVVYMKCGGLRPAHGGLARGLLAAWLVHYGFDMLIISIVKLSS